ncbi:MAG: AMP-binding protein, partial [Clostridia bacterium]|nr:AMP-binding protein [Clostridia bacterium]
MKLSFSTNGWHGFDWADFTAMAVDLGYDGIEIHNISDARLSGEGAPFSPGRLPETSRQLFEQGLQIPCLDVLGNIADADALDANLTEISDMLDCAALLHTPYLRLHATQAGEDPDATVKTLVRRALPLAEKRGVTLLVETVGVYADTVRLRELLNSFACDHLAALWDIHHPYRFAGEDPEQTIQNLGAYIKHVHVKDSVTRDGEVFYCLLGEGELPMDALVSALRSINYDGFFSFECSAAWLQDLGDEAIAFPHFAHYMRRFDGADRTETKLFDNKSHTGQYVWKKETLINKTFPQVLDRMVEEFPDQLTFKYTTLDYTRTYAEFREDVDTCARALIALGVKAGDHVAIWANNLPQWYITFWATTKIGAVLVTVNTAYKVHEAEYLLRQSDTHTLVMMEENRDSKYSEIIRELCPELEETVPGEPLHSRRLPFLRNVITVGYRQTGCLTWEEA